jgi:hypothetical protein
MQYLTKRRNVNASKHEANVTTRGVGRRTIKKRLQPFARAVDYAKLWIVPLASRPCELQPHSRSYSGDQNPFVGWIFALAILFLWISSALADPLTLRVVAASPGYSIEGRPSITVTLDDDGRQSLSQFTYKNVGKDVEIHGDGRLLMKARLRTPLTGGQVQIVGGLSADEAANLANRLAIAGKIEVNEVTN